ncbi:MAG: hypothetical protein K2M46_03470 [Lachnospiraceae bacterium]|nr:hypothetical protein [Lachnospiraceae bacterium]
MEKFETAVSLIDGIKFEYRKTAFHPFTYESAKNEGSYHSLGMMPI